MNTVLILHGWGSCGKNWARVKNLLEKRGINVIVPDLPGFGENTSLDRAWTMDDYVEWVKKYGDENNLAPFFLLGHSFGGNIALEYAVKFPEDVKKLILVDAAVIRVKHTKRKILAKLAKIIKTFSFLPFYDLLRRIFYRFVASDYPGLEGALKETYLAVVKKDLSELLPRVSVPTSIIWGEKDKITPLKDAYFIKERVSGATLDVVPGAKHAPSIETPEVFVDKISNVIEQ